jgi:cystathionine beta-lyase/cystathionine gamma-synthase
MGDAKKYRFATRAVHAGRAGRSSDAIPTVTPIHPSVSYHYKHIEDLDEVFAGKRAGYTYSRYGSPTVTAVEEAVADLEGGEKGLAFSSGMAAIQAVLLAVGVRAGSAVVAAQDLYGMTYALLDQVFRTQGVTVRFVDAVDIEAVNKACAELGPVALLVETISNPLLKVADIEALAGAAHRHGAALLVDNTFAASYLVRPLALGADIVINSATKYLGGHDDVLGGTVVTSRERFDALYQVLKLTGANLGPYEAWLLLRGLKTLYIRMQRHCRNAAAVAAWLEGHPLVGRVFYPGLKSHPQHDLAGRLFGERGFGGVIAFEIEGAGREEVFRFFDALHLCLPAATLGDVHSLVLYPAHSSHRALTADERKRIGIGDGLVRLSVGIEALEDIVDDLSQALGVLRGE